MGKKNSDCGTYLHGWMCSGAYMKLAKFKPWLDVDNIAAELNECCDPVSVMVSDERQDIEDVIEKFADVESINPHAMWLHPFFIGFNYGYNGWIVVAVDKVYNDSGFGNGSTTMCLYNHNFWLISD